PRRLTRGRHDDGAPAWSPNGRRIAFTRGSPSKRDVYLMRADGAHVRRLTKLPRGVTSPTWSPDGRRIAFGMGRRGRRAMHVIRSDGRGLRKLTSGAADLRSIDWQREDPDPLVAAAGDIACDPGAAAFLGRRRACRQRETSDLLLKMDLSAVLALGDLQYSDGQLAKFMQSFHPSWGRLKSLIRPVVGNHEYATPGAAGYFDYFNGPGQLDGPAGRRGLGYYSYNLGEWHVVALNSICSQVPGGCAAGSAQERWLRADLAANPRPCTLAYWHHPPVSSGAGGTNPELQPLVQALYDHGVDVLLTGHDHSYERFAPQDPAGNRDAERGIRQFIVGSGGRDHRRAVAIQPNSEVRDDTTFGVLELRLRPHGYFWTFVPERKAGFTDSGANACH
ncbi:MAG: metallophosphoesterase, partial [Solirubrobacteraceae bacterium]